MITLKEKGILAAGTIRSKRIKNGCLMNEKELMKKGRGSYDFKFEVAYNLVACRWYEHKSVQLVSNYIAENPVSKCKRWCCKQNKYMHIPTHMGGVYLADMLSELYKINHRSKKWYMRIVYWGLSTAVVNSWLLYRRDLKNQKGRTKHMSLLNFQLMIANELLHASDITPVNQRKRGRPSAISTNMQSDSLSPASPAPSYISNVSSQSSSSSTKRSYISEPPKFMRLDQAGHWVEWGPKGRRSNLHNVSDIFVMGGCLILECLVLFHWCERNGYGPLGLTGLSMGGHMASLAATNWPKPIVVVPCLSWSSAAAVFTTGVMSHSINWDMLETQYYADGKYSERLSKMVTVIDDAFTAGQQFIKNFKQSLKELEKDINESQYKRGLESILNQTDTKSNEQQIDKTNFICDHSGTPKNGISQLNAELDLLNFKAPINSENMDISVTNEQSTLTKLMKYILPKKSFVRSERIDISKTNWWEREALQFMRGMMDECTHLKNFSVPYDTSLIIAVCAKDDAYVPREGCSNLEDIWPGVEVRYLDAGHVSAYVLHQKLFRSCIVEAFERAKIKCAASVIEARRPELTYAQLIKKYTNSM